MLKIVLVLQLAVWQPVRPPLLHQGHWQSCLQDDGTYAERVLEHRVRGKILWEAHLGPGDEFAIYDHIVDGEHSHDDPANLLGSAFHYDAFKSYVGRSWTVTKLKLWINIVRTGGSRDECEAFWIRIETKS